MATLPKVGTLTSRSNEEFYVEFPRKYLETPDYPKTDEGWAYMVDQFKVAVAALIGKANMQKINIIREESEEVVAMSWRLGEQWADYSLVLEGPTELLEAIADQLP